MGQMAYADHRASSNQSQSAAGVKRRTAKYYLPRQRDPVQNSCEEESAIIIRMSTGRTTRLVGV